MIACTRLIKGETCSTVYRLLGRWRAAKGEKLRIVVQDSHLQERPPDRAGPTSQDHER
jgi:hypothetical protein